MGRENIFRKVEDSHPCLRFREPSGEVHRTSRNSMGCSGAMAGYVVFGMRITIWNTITCSSAERWNPVLGHRDKVRKYSRDVFWKKATSYFLSPEASDLRFLEELNRIVQCTSERHLRRTFRALPRWPSTGFQRSALLQVSSKASKQSKASIEIPRPPPRTKNPKLAKCIGMSELRMSNETARNGRRKL